VTAEAYGALRRRQPLHTDDFLRDVARAYAAAPARGERPNRAIAEQVSTSLWAVQRWVYTARQRGIMQPGRQGTQADPTPHAQDFGQLCGRLRKSTQ
jgi:hypothetical protein